MRHFTKELSPPYIAVIFTSRLKITDHSDYAATSQRMAELAAEQPGYLGVESHRDEDGFGITVSYWSDEQAVQSWSRQAEHLLAQKGGREKWYSEFDIKICNVVRQRQWQAQ